MSLYVLVEGKRTEPAIYPYWLNILNSNLIQVDKIENISQKMHYCLESGRGYPQIINHINRGVNKILTNKITIVNFVIIIDSEEDDPNSKEQEFANHCNTEYQKVPFNFKIFVQPISIEAWLLGNRKIYPTVNANLREFYDFYHTKSMDPELIPPLSKSLEDKYTNRATFSNKYLKILSIEKGHQHSTYQKTNPSFVKNASYFEQLTSRHKETGHLKYFNNFCNWFENYNP